ncbi:hypothetical protein AAZX31_02G008700 [Glycine max]
MNTCRNVGFVSDDVGLDPDKCKVLVNIEQQSPDIAQGVHGHFTKRPEEVGAGDREHVIKPVIPEKYLDDKTIFHLNPSGRFVIGGPHGDAGLTGRKIIIDTYCGWGAHGGGAFSGKDPTKVDRSGAYVARQQQRFGTGKIPDKEILQLVKKNFDFRPGMITINLDLKRGGHRFLKTAAYGHFGREDPDFTWEVVKPLKWDKPQA